MALTPSDVTPPAPSETGPAEVNDGAGMTAVRWRRARWLAAACYVAVFAISAVHDGIPLLRVSVVIWTLGALAVHCIGRGWWRFGRALLDWLPFTAVMICYDLSRGAADTLGQPVQVSWPATADRWLFAGTVPSVWLQHEFHTPDAVHWYDVAALATYFSFFLVVPITMAVLWVRDRRLWQRFTANVVTLSCLALLIYVAFPEAPPWYAAQRGAIGTITRISSVGWADMGLRTASDLVEQGQAIANDVAAMPSLHEAYTMLVALFFLRRLPRRARPLLCAYPVAMGLSLVYTGEHYVVDVLAGIGCAVLVHTVVCRIADGPAARCRAQQPDVADREPADATTASMSGQ